MLGAGLLIVATLGSGPAVEATLPEAVPVVVAEEAIPSSEVARVPPGTPVRLMILKEINSRTAVVGERFRLRVSEPIFINGKPVVPVGTDAWAEVFSAQRNGAVGKGGKLVVKLLYIDAPGGQIPLRGEVNDEGGGNAGGVLMAVVGFGIFGLLNGGDSARLKGGETFTGFVDDYPSPQISAEPIEATQQ